MKYRMVCAATLLAAFVSTIPAGRASGQQTVAAGADDNRGRGAADELLSRIVTIDVHDASLRHAIDLASQSAGVPIQYQTEVLDAYSRTVTLRATRQPLRAVLDRVLSGTALQVIADGPRRLAIVRDAATRQGERIITGHVIDAKTQRPLANVVVTLDGRAQVVRTDSTGLYRFTNVRAGTHTVQARVVGFLQQAKSVTVGDEATPTVDFVLENSAVNTLDQVVVTATGEQHVRELGHVVARLNADSLVRSAPISSVAELLQSRVPGLQVFTGSGSTAGSAVALRLRGQTTVNLNPEPIVIVDGVRFKTTNLVQGGAAYSVLSADTRNTQYAANDVRSPLSDLNPNDIETVEVVKGASASTLYGPDASNGVIIITTKRGKVGTPEFRWYARPMSNDARVDRVSTVYRAYGHSPDTNTLFPGNCSLVYQYDYKICVLDSIAVAPTLLGDPTLSVVAKNRPAWQYGASVSGGSPAVRYFLSGNYDSQLGALNVSPRIARYLTQITGTNSIDETIRHPNALRNGGGHASVSADLGTQGSVTAVVGYAQTYNRTAPIPTGAFSGIAIGTDTSAIGNLLNPYQFLVVSEDQSSRLTGSLNGVYRPTEWLNVNATVGLDMAPSVLHSVLPRDGTVPDYLSAASDSRRSNVGRTMNLGATAIARANNVTFRSSLGAQYVYSHLDGVDITATNLAPGSASIQSGSQLSSSQVWDETVTLNSYGEEVIGVNDRLFLTGSLNVNGSTSFGDAYHPTPYPKVGASWIVSDEPFFPKFPLVEELRLRYSLGVSSRNPTSSMKLGRQNGSLTYAEGQNQTMFNRTSFANPDLRPERSREAEYGIDATLWSDARLGLTWYNRRTSDQILLIRNVGALLPIYGNLGLLTAHGFEATFNATVINTSMLRGDILFNYAYNTDRVVSLGKSPDNRSNYFGYAVGYPLAAYFVRPLLGVADTVGDGAGHGHDGIVFPEEIIDDSVARFAGVTIPPRTYTLTPSVSLFESRLRLSTTFDRATDFIAFNLFATQDGFCLAAYDKTASLLAQARCQRSLLPDRGDYTRWRELTVSIDVPQRLLHLDALHLHFSHASVSLQGRNLKLWTSYPGSDPESHSDSNLAGPTTSGFPQAQTWSFRFDVTP